MDRPAVHRTFYRMYSGFFKKYIPQIAGLCAKIEAISGASLLKPHHQ